MPTSLEKLISQLSQEQTYKPLTENEIRTQAAQRYQSVYDEKRLNAKQAWETEDASLARELSGLQKSYDQQRVSSAAQTRNTYSQADRHALSRGMQRSSYNEATLAGIDLAGDEAQRAIDQAQTEHEAAIGEKRTALGRQLSETIRQLDQNQRSDELAYADELAQREYDRAVQSRNTYSQLAMQLYEYQHELEQEAAEQARWQAEFNARYGGGSGGASRKRTSTPAAAEPQKVPVKAVTLPVKPSSVRRSQRESTK